MKFCTFNVNSVRAREELLLKWLENRENDLDVLCLQEIKVTDDKFPWDAFSSLGYHCEVFGQKAYNGVAVLSKEKPTAVTCGFGDSQWDQQKRFMHCRVGDVTVINIYAPHGDVRGSEKYTYKKGWYQFFRTYLQENFRPQDPLLVVGDLNVALTDLDVHDPLLLKDTVCTMPEERNWLQDVLDWGLWDAFRQLHPDKQAFTWWDYIGGAIWQGKGMRIDYILCTKPLLDQLEQVEVDLWPRRRRTPKPSDHAPVILTLQE